MTLHIHHYPNIREFCDFVGGSGIRIPQSRWSDRFGGWSTTEILQGIRSAMAGTDPRIDWRSIEAKVDGVGQLVDATYDRPARSWLGAPMGAYPIIPEVLSGHPMPMRMLAADPFEQSPMRMVIDSSVAIAVTDDLMHQRAYTIAALLLRLMETRPVQVDVCFAGLVDGAMPYLANQMVVVSMAPHDALRQLLIMASAAWFPIHLGPLAAVIHARANHETTGISPLWNSQDLGDRYVQRVRQAMGLAHEDLYIPPARLVDVQALLANPGRWLRDVMNQQE